MTGPSSSGKTTLLTLVGALRQVQQGSVQILGRELAGINGGDLVRHRRDIGFIFQHHNLFSSLTALENVRMATALRPAGVEEMERRAEAILGRLGLSDRLHYRPGRLSRRPAASGSRSPEALVNDPALVLADELHSGARRRVKRDGHEPAPRAGGRTDALDRSDRHPRPALLIERADRIVSMVGGRIVSNVRPKLVVRICEILARVKELEGLGTSTLTRMAEQMTVEFHRAGETIVREGEVGERTYIISQGVAEASSGDARARPPHRPEVRTDHRPLTPPKPGDRAGQKPTWSCSRLPAANSCTSWRRIKSLDERIRLYYMNVQS